MRIVTGGHAIWMGGWSNQVHLGKDVICLDADPVLSAGCLARPLALHGHYLEHSFELADGTRLLVPACALADSLIFRDHRLMAPDEIDPDYIEEPVFEIVQGQINSMCELIGRTSSDLLDTLMPYEDRLRPT